MKKITILAVALMTVTLSAQQVIAVRGQRHASASYVSATNIYRIGGHMRYDSSVFQRFPLDKSGTPTRQIINTGKFLPDRALYSPSIAVKGNYLYIVTGVLNDRTMKKQFALPGVMRYTIDAKGDLTDLKILPPLPEDKIYASGVLVSGKYILVIGGYFKRNCYAAEILANGDLGPWKKLRPVPSNVMAKDHLVVNGNRLYICGGGGHNLANDKMYMTELDEDGLPGRWQRMSPMPVKVYTDSVLLPESARTMLFIDGKVNKIYRGTFDAEGDVTEWKLIPGAKIPGGTNFISFDVKKLRNGKWILLNALHNKPRKFIPATMFTIPGAK